MHKFIPYGTQNIGKEDIEAVIAVLKSDFISTGPKIKEFEEKFAQYVGSKYAVAVSSGTAALNCACLAAGIKNGDEVITTPLTFIATSNVILYCGAKPVFVDINPSTFNIDENLIEDKITNKTKAIMPVHFAGLPCDMDKIQTIAKKYNLKIIDDASHALGAEYKNIRIGTFGDMTTFSFHPVKHITTGEGGMITTNDEKLYRRLLLFRNHGITRDENDFINSKDGNWYYEQIELGYNYRLTDFQSALGIVQLDKMNYSLSRRNEIVKMYEDGLKDVKEIELPQNTKKGKSAWHLYIIKIIDEKIDRKLVFDELRNRNIGVNVHYIPVYYNPYYEKLGYKRGICPNAEKVYKQIITLPIHPKMTNDDVEYVIENIKNIIGDMKKNG